MKSSTHKYIFVIVFIALLGGGYYFYQASGQNGANQKFRTVKVTRGDISTVVTATGTINPVITVLVGSQVSGTIKALHADFNSRVKQGQVIAQIDPAIFQAQVDQARANVLNAQANLLNTQSNLKNVQANLAKAEVAVVDAKRTMDRNRPLVEKKVIAQAVFDTAQTNYDSAIAQEEAAKAQIESARAQIESSKAQVEQTKAALKLAETNLGYTTIRSPVNGIVISRNVDVGQTVAASLQAPTLFTIAQDLTKMQVDTNVSEADVGRIAVGQDATFTVDAYPEKTFQGKVSEIRNAPTTVQNVVTYDVVIQVDNKELKLKPGMTANVTVLIEHKEGVLKISNAALRFRPESAKGEGTVEKKKGSTQSTGKTAGGPFGEGKPGRGGEGRPGRGGEGKPGRGGEGGPGKMGEGRPGRVWIASAEGKPIPVPLVLGITDGTFSEVVSGDLKEATEVIVENTSKQKGQAQKTASPPFMRGMGR
jgi:HlyD family secretion protein